MRIGREMANSVTSTADFEFSEWSEDATPEQWFVDLAGVRLGPLDRAGLLEMYESGNLRADDRIQPVGLTIWEPLRTLWTNQPGHNADSSLGDDYLPPSRHSATLDDSSEEAFAAVQLDELDVSQTSSSEALPQFFFIINDREVGPVLFDTLQELADEQEIDRTTHIRAEASSVWMTAKELGVRFPVITRDPAAPKPRAVPIPKQSEHQAAPQVQCTQTPSPNTTPTDKANSNNGYSSILGGLMWAIFAPFHYLSAVAASIGNVRRTQAITCLATALVMGAWIHSLYWNWSTTAVTGTIRIGEQPLPAVLVTLTNMLTGETAIGFTNSSGAFSVKTLSGKLSPGTYRVTVARPSEYESADLPELPRPYQALATSNLDIEYDGQSLAIQLHK